MSAEAHARALSGLELANATQRCGARCRRNNGAPCMGPAITGKARCRMHGGRSTGPSSEGRERLGKKKTIHGKRSRIKLRLRSEAARTTQQVWRLLSSLEH